MKKIDKLILQSFFPPFLATLFISVFLFFLVQIIVTYLDDFVGKGLRISDLLTLFGYAWITIIPQCIPLAVLLASIMCYGNLAEHYELATMKACGISLFRTIRPVFIGIVFLASGTFLFNNYVLPRIYFKFSLLLMDIRQKKPTINIKEGIFYNKITNYSIRVGKKDSKTDTLYDVMIYDHTNIFGNFIQIYAEKGMLLSNADTSRLIIQLFNGKRYEYQPRTFSNPNNNFNTMSFRKLDVYIDIRDFKFRRTDEKNYKGAEEMLNLSQLDSLTDSTKKKLQWVYLNRMEYVRHNVFIRYYNFPSDTSRYRRCISSLPNDSVIHGTKISEVAMNIIRNLQSSLESSEMMENSEKKYLTALAIEWHRKWVLSVACIILFFIGAPLGAIIRKGGLGLPVVIAVMFFLAYYILTEFFTGLAMERILEPAYALWAPVVIFFPVSIFLTSQAAFDAGWMDAQVLAQWIEKAQKRFKKLYEPADSV